ncbi:MAG: hypothetical protein RL091_2258 [Verrucomicrobiota bacterium]|jgi:putative methyltransferase (TIGR04325 family)
MTLSWKALARKLLPLAWREWWRQRFGWKWFRGDCADWREALAQSKGYADQAGISRVVDAARAVRSGRASWDRDGALFFTPSAHQPLLEALLAVAAENAGRLAVLDFGGALGSTWWQHRGALAGVVTGWRIVEQAALVEAGRREFSDAPLSFHASLGEATAAGPVHVLLLSSVLPYVESPPAILAEVAAHGFRHVVLDRTPFIKGGKTRLVVQTTPPALGGGSYPCWLFDRDSLLAPLMKDYEVVSEWPVEFDRVDASVSYRGMHLRRRSQSPAQSA